MSFTAGQTLTAALLNTATKKILARGRRTTTSSNAAPGPTGVLRIDDIAITSGRLYMVCTSGLGLDSSVANDVMRAHVRYTTDGTTPTTSSTVLPGSAADGRQADAAWGETRNISTVYAPAANETLSLLLCITRTSGTGNATVFGNGVEFVTDLYLIDLGVDTGDVGTDI